MASNQDSTERPIEGAGKPEPTRILIACMPKSGSTFLSDVICALPDFKRAKVSPAPAEGRQHELDVECLRLAGSGNFVGQVHVLNSEWTARLCKDFRLKPVVLVRSLPDAIVSLRDHVRREGGGEIFFDDPHAAAFDDAQLEAMLARFLAPWYVNFYMGWRRAPDALMISYEELTADPQRILRRIVDFAGAAVDDRTIAQAIATVRENGKSRLNVGVAGRGAKLRPEILRELVGLFDFFAEAADDPYVKGVRAQAAAALAGEPPPRLGPVALHSPPVAPRVQPPPSRFARLAKVARRYGYQATLIATGLLYWIWPEDIIPDDRWLGHVDDAIFITLLAFLAGRVSKRTPGLRDLPAYLRRRIGRRRLGAAP